jgi:hypothetical protein
VPAKPTELLSDRGGGDVRCEVVCQEGLAEHEGQPPKEVGIEGWPPPPCRRPEAIDIFQRSWPDGLSRRTDDERRILNATAFEHPILNLGPTVPGELIEEADRRQKDLVDVMTARCDPTRADRHREAGRSHAVSDDRDRLVWRRLRLALIPDPLQGLGEVCFDDLVSRSIGRGRLAGGDVEAGSPVQNPDIETSLAKEIDQACPPRNEEGVAGRAGAMNQQDRLPAALRTAAASQIEGGPVPDRELDELEVVPLLERHPATNLS